MALKPVQLLVLLPEEQRSLLWLGEPVLAVAMMVETTDDLNNGGDSMRRFPFQGSSAPLYAAENYAFAPMLVAISAARSTS